jgi:hypothetical protein
MYNLYIMDFDYNIENYTKKDLIEIFGLPNNYDKNIIDIKENKLRENIISNNEINKDIQIKTLNFLIKAKNILLSEEYTHQPKKNTRLEEKIIDFYNSSYKLKPTKLESQNDHMVEIRSETPYLSSFPSQFFPGIINPLKKRALAKNLNIDTKFRDNYYSSPSTNFTMTLPIILNNVLTMQLNAIELPTTFYNISKQFGNNYFTLTVNTETAVVNIPDGNYDYNGIVQVINNELLLLGGVFVDVTFIINVNSSGTNGSGQMMVGAKPSVTTLSLDFQADKFGNYDTSTPLPLKLGWKLGFRNGVYEGNLNYVSEGVVDLTGPRYLYLVIDDYHNNVNNNFYSAFTSSLLNKNILARISLAPTAPFSSITQNNLNIITTPREYFGPVNIQNLNVQLLDEYGRVFDLNNMDYSFCLKFETVYDI